MSRRIAGLTLLWSGSSLLLQAAVWPEQLWENKRTALSKLTITNPAERALFEEYGLEAAEEATYGNWRGVGFRLKDPTSAYAVFQWKRPAGARPSTLEKYAVQTADRAFLLKGNFVLDFIGRIPTQQEVDILHIQLARLDQSPLPGLPTFMPSNGLIAGSERFLIGPVGLQQFLPKVPPSTAAFSMEAEAYLARFQTPKGDADLALFYYPNPQIARDRLVEFQKIPGAAVKRTGPIVAVIPQPPDPDEAEKLLAKVNYQATITWNEKPPTPEPSTADFLLGVFINIGLLALGAVLCGVAYAGFRIAWRKVRGKNEDDESMLTLDLGGRR